MGRKKVEKKNLPQLEDIIDVVWTLSQKSSTPEEKEAASAKMKEMGMYFATPIQAKITKPGDK